MIGRGVLSNPFLAEEIKTGTDIDYVEKLKRIYRFHNDLFEEYAKVVSGATHLVDKMKGIWVYLAQSFDDPKRVLKKITKTHTIAQYRAVIESLLVH
jgi:tRNA-dihydrouridine synthase B